eukprot:1825489-Pleurochrysis_carterae.AAC.6
MQTRLRADIDTAYYASEQKRVRVRLGGEGYQRRYKLALQQRGCGKCHKAGRMRSLLSVACNHQRRTSGRLLQPSATHRRRRGLHLEPSAGVRVHSVLAWMTKQSADSA